MEHDDAIKRSRFRGRSNLELLLGLGIVVLLLVLFLPRNPPPVVEYPPCVAAFTTGPSPLPLLKEFKSQAGQDRFVYEQFFVNKTEPGIFVEFGARDGVTHSNTYFFEHSLRWQGLLIEAADYETGNLTAERPRSLFLQAGICRNHSRVIFASTNKASGLGGVKAHFYPERYAQHVKQEKEIPCYTLEEVLVEAGLYKIDYMIVDTEGSEVDILQSLNFTLFWIDVLQVELVLLHKERKKALERLMEEKGYRFISALPLGFDTYDYVYKRTPAANERFLQAKKEGLKLAGF
jgi:hypothetical protein